MEQYFQRAKDDLGLDHYKERSWRGFHHHLLMAVLAYLFVAAVYPRAKKTSDVTWERTLNAMRPWLVRRIGLCSCCGTKWSEITKQSNTWPMGFMVGS